MVRIACILLLFLAAAAGRAADDITILGLFRDHAIIRVDGRRVTLSAGETTDDGIRLISADSDKAVLEMDGRRHTYRLGEHIGGRFSEATPRHVVTVAPDSQGMYFVNGSINNFQVRFVVDTGATLIAMNRNQARRIGLDYRMQGRRSSSSTASGIAPVYIVTLDKVRVGDIVLHDVDAAVHDSDFPETILLGNSFLSRISLNREGRLLELQQN